MSLTGLHFAPALQGLQLLNKYTCNQIKINKYLLKDWWCVGGYGSCWVGVGGAEGTMSQGMNGGGREFHLESNVHGRAQV